MTSLTAFYSLLFTPDFFEYFRGNYLKADTYSLIISYCNTIRKFRHNGTNAIIVPSDDPVVNRQMNAQLSEFIDILIINLFQKKSFEESLVFSFWLIKQIKNNKDTTIDDLMNKILLKEDDVAPMEFQQSWTDEQLKSLAKSLRNKTNFKPHDTPHSFTWNQLRTIKSLTFDLSGVQFENEKTLSKLFSSFANLSNLKFLRLFVNDRSASTPACFLFNTLMINLQQCQFLKEFSLISREDVHSTFIDCLLQLKLDSLDIKTPSPIKLNQMTKIPLLFIESNHPLVIQFDKCKVIESLSLSNLPVSINELIRFLNNFPNLKHLYINSYSGQKRVLKTLPKILKLQTLVINGVDDSSIKELLPVISHIFEKANNLKTFQLNHHIDLRFPPSIETLSLPTLKDFDLPNLRDLTLTRTLNCELLANLTKNLKFLPDCFRKLNLVLPQQQNQEFSDLLRLFFIELSLTKIQWLKILNLEIDGVLLDFVNCSTYLFSIQPSLDKIFHLSKNYSRLGL